MKLQILWLHLHICSLGQFVIFRDITGFQRRGFIQVLSMNLHFGDIWVSGKIHALATSFIYAHILCSKQYFLWHATFIIISIQIEDSHTKSVLKLNSTPIVKHLLLCWSISRLVSHYLMICHFNHLTFQGDHSMKKHLKMCMPYSWQDVICSVMSIKYFLE